MKTIALKPQLFLFPKLQRIAERKTWQKRKKCLSQDLIVLFYFLKSPSAFRHLNNLLEWCALLVFFLNQNNLLFQVGKAFRFVEQPASENRTTNVAFGQQEFSTLLHSVQIGPKVVACVPWPRWPTKSFLRVKTRQRNRQNSACKGATYENWFGFKKTTAHPWIHLGFWKFDRNGWCPALQILCICDQTSSKRNCGDAPDPEFTTEESRGSRSVLSLQNRPLWSTDSAKQKSIRFLIASFSYLQRAHLLGRTAEETFAGTKL